MHQVLGFCFVYLNQRLGHDEQNVPHHVSDFDLGLSAAHFLLFVQESEDGAASPLPHMRQ